MDISQQKQRLRDAIISAVRHADGYTKVVEKAVEKTKEFEEKYFIPPTPGDLLDFCHLEKLVLNEHDWYEGKVLFKYAQIMHKSLTFCGSNIPLLIMTNLMMSHQGSWRMSREHAGTHCSAQSTVGHHAGAHLSLPPSCVCNHPINPLRHIAIS